jgi:hypothetical protein
MRRGFALALVAGGAVWMALASQALADSCSEHEDSCNNACFRRTGDAATVCFSSCKIEKRACLKTGIFRTNGGIYPDLDRH